MRSGLSAIPGRMPGRIVESGERLLVLTAVIAPLRGIRRAHRRHRYRLGRHSRAVPLLGASGARLPRYLRSSRSAVATAPLALGSLLDRRRSRFRPRSRRLPGGSRRLCSAPTLPAAPTRPATSARRELLAAGPADATAPARSGFTMARRALDADAARLYARTARSQAVAPTLSARAPAADGAARARVDARAVLLRRAALRGRSPCGSVLAPRPALGEPLAGALRALLLSVSPTFLYQAVQPMSDVPVDRLLAGRAAARAPAARVGAGSAPALAASLAILIRPNLAPLAPVRRRGRSVQRSDRGSTCAAPQPASAAMVPAVAVLGCDPDGPLRLAAVVRLRSARRSVLAQRTSGRISRGIRDG